MTHLDQLLDDLRETGPDPRLGQMDAAILKGVAATKERHAARRGLALTAIVALGIGFGASIFPARQAEAGHAALGKEGALNSLPASAPSSLLLGQR